MMGILADLLLAAQCSLPFGAAYKRLRHMRNGHRHKDAILIDKMKSIKHPHSGEGYVSLST